MWTVRSDYNSAPDPPAASNMLLNLKNLSLNLGSTVLLDKVELTLERGERLCLVGRNGTGKSTLMKLIAGSILPDGGDIVRAQNLRVAQLPQDVPKGLAGTVYQVAAAGLGEAGRLVAEYHRLLHDDPDNMKALGDIQSALEAHDGWSLDSRVQAVLTRLDLDGDVEFAALSGGLKRRTLLAQALVAEPDLLLLDEPTNHLDIDSIAWLEEFLLGWNGTLLFITHDRAFLRRLATRIIELDRGILRSWPGTYDDYLRRKEEALRAEAQQGALFDKRLAQEEAWIRKGIEARRTRNQGRVERLYKLRDEDRARRKLPGQVKLAVQEAERSGKLVVEAENVTFARGERVLVNNFSTTLLRGDKLGIIGPNGAGKTTLLNLLLGKLAPDSGKLKNGTNLQVAYFDQLRALLDENKPVYENIGDGKDRDRRQQYACDELPAEFPVHAGPGTQPGQGAIRRRALAPAAGAAVRPALQPAGAGRADQRSGRGDARPAGGKARRIQRHRAAGQP